VGAGSTVNIPANASHAFKNVSTTPVRMLCMCPPAGQEGFFMEVGDLVDCRTAVPPKLTEEEIGVRRKKAGSQLAKYRTEMVGS
jgi:oxalate decarboxylase/phosphoglucose isomerase-like protein (cupin superfamily)